METYFAHPHAPFAQSPDYAKAAGESGCKLSFSFCSLNSEGSAITGTEGIIVRVSTLASGASLHERR
jgi:hypothetical protein